MNIIDIIILCCFIPAIIRGFSKGFVDQAYSLIALIAGVWLSFKFSGALGDWLVSFADLPAGVLHLIAFAVILLAVMFLVHLAGNVVEKLLKVVMLGWLNKLLGIVFAIIKAVLVIGLVIILFDALDGRVHSDEKMIATLCYYEYCEMWLGSQPENKGVRKIQTVVREHEPGAQDDENNTISYEITAVKCKDHVLLTVDDGARTMETTIALPDSTRYAYIGITGEYCDIRDISIEQSETPIDETYIPRIAEEVSFLDGPEGDIPNLQVNGYRTEASQGIPLHQRLTIRYHSKSLPTARLVWHCPYFVIYSSDDGVIHGPNYREFSLIRLDGEDWEAENVAENKLFINKHDSFEGWDVWKATHKKGIDSSITFIREGDMITATTENLGISLESITKILDGTQNVYVAITGDQCTITNIRIDEA